MKLDLTALNLLEKWIVEHGSAAVMGVHIQLLRDQLSALDREATNLKAKVADLEAANKDLTDKCQRRAARIHELEVAQAKANEDKKGAGPPEPKDGQLRVLRALPSPSRQGWVAYEIANRLQILADEVDSHIKKLSGGDYIKSEWDRYGHGSDAWSRSDSGNDYVIAWRLSQTEPVKLTQAEEEILKCISRFSDGVGDKYMYEQFGRRLNFGTWEQFKACLATLFCEGFISPVSEFTSPSYGMGETVFVEPSGTKYLTEHGPA